MKNNFNLVIAIIVIIIVNLGLIIPSVAADGLILVNNVTPFSSSYGTISINATSLEGVVSLPVYHGTFGENGSINFQIQQIGKVRQNVTTESDAPVVGQRVLEQYGGLPSDAVLNGASTTYLETYDHTLQIVTNREPMFTTVSYSRDIDGFWVYGDGNTIILTLGENGELLRIFKIWRDYTYTRDVKIISVYSAFEKLHRGELINAPMVSTENITIDIASPDYYANKVENNDTELEPIWLLVGRTESGSRVGFYVYARKFANFTATPAEVTKWQAVQFNDTSETNVTKWFWEFGDGTNSTEQNPSHIYRDGGNYTVNLTVWNDLGSDSISREDHIHVYYSGLPPVARFTSNYTVSTNPFYPVSSATIQFYDQSNITGNNTQWFWDFGDGTNSTEQNPVHTLTYVDVTGENLFDMVYSIALTVTDEFGRTATTYQYYHIFNDYHMDFAGEPTSGPTPLTVNFTDLPDEIPEYSVDWRLWDFGDGATYEWTAEWDETWTIILNPAPKTVSHVYTSPGNYTVTLTKQYSEMGYYAKTKEHYILVGGHANIPAADFTVNSTLGQEPLAVAFLDQSTLSPNFWIWSFGDGTNSTDKNPIHIYTEAGTYSVSLTAANNDGSDTTIKQDYIHVLPTAPPFAEFSANVTSGYPPLPVAFTDLSTNAPVNWTWDFGDGSSSTEKNPEHTFAAMGNYTVSLLVMNNEGGNSTTGTECIRVLIELPVIIDDSKVAPISDFTSNTTTGKVPLAVAFNDTSVFYPQHWNWSFGDGATSTDQNPEYFYTVPGTYTVNLTTGNLYGENLTVKTEYISVLPLSIPDANFTATPTTGKVPLTVIFNDTSSGTPTIWLWNFGDGTTSAEQAPVHEYATAGTYTVSLTATNDDGSDTETRPDYITVTLPVPLVADFNANTTSGIIPLAVAFTDTSSGSPTSWSWTFGDGGASSEQNPVYVYTTTGQFTVSLQVTNEDGNNTTTKEQFITGSTLNLPVAEFISNTTSGNAPLAVGFTDQSTGSPVSWQWSFGDGATSDEQNPSHLYTDTGTYTVSLEVTNPDGSNTATKTDYITVSSDTQLPVAGFKGKPTCGKSPLTVKFNDTSTGSPASWFWEFGDGSSANEQNPVHVYTTAGKYSVSLTSTNAGGSNTSTRTDYITVSGSVKPPVANFYGKPTSGKAPLSVKFTDTSTGSPATWYWNFGDGTNATDRNPVHSYTNPGKYMVSLTVANAGGSNTKTRTEYITVKGTPPPTANFYGKPTSGKAPLSVKFTDASTGSPSCWYWEFGDGTTDTAQHPVHSYTAAGKYTVSLTASNAAGNTTKTRTEYITVKSTTPTPTQTCTPSQCEPHEVPQVTGSITQDNKVHLNWDVITNPCLQGYKIVISKNNPNPKYPDDGYMFWITNRNTNYSIISSADHYNGGDFGGYLQPGESYYFSVTAVYSDTKVAGNVVGLEYMA